MNTYIIIIFIILISSISICSGLQVRSLKSHKSYQRLSKDSLHMSDKDIVDDGKTNPSFGFVGGLAVAGNMCLDYTLYVLKTTGCPLPPSPKYGEDTLIAEQAVSVLVVLGVLIYSVIVKKDTGIYIYYFSLWNLFLILFLGRGLPAGPAGLLGAAEGLSYLTVLAALIFVPWQFLGKKQILVISLLSHY